MRKRGPVAACAAPSGPRFGLFQEPVASAAISGWALVSMILWAEGSG